MTNPENKPQDDSSRTQQDKNRADSEQESNDKARGKHSESSYPNDDYWERGVGQKSKAPPAESPEPDTGYRWEPSDGN